LAVTVTDKKRILSKKEKSNRIRNDEVSMARKENSNHVQRSGGEATLDA
jgi:hypothetical protein